MYESVEAMTHPSNVLFYALYDDVRETTVILRKHRKTLDDGPRVYGQIRQSLHVVTSKHVRIEVVNRLRGGRSGVGEGVGWWYWCAIALRGIGHLGVCGTLRIERHRGGPLKEQMAGGGWLRFNR